MKRHFTQLRTIVCQKIQKRLDTKEFRLRNFSVYMTTLFPPQECIPKTTDVSRIFTAITHNGLWDYLNYLPLERVASMYGGNDPDLKTKLEAYSHKLSGFKARTTVEDCMSSSPVTVTCDRFSSTLPRYDQHFRSELAVKFQVPNLPQSLSDTDGAWKSLSTNFRLPPSSAILDKTVEGSLHIKWLIPAFFVPQIMEMAEQPQIIELFREMKAELVTVDGACLYGEKEVIYFCVLYTCIHVSCVHVFGFAVCLSCHIALIMVLWSRANKHVTIA